MTTRTREERLRIADEILARLREKREREATAQARREDVQLELPIGPLTEDRSR